MLPIDFLTVSHFTIPSDSIESDGTLEWDKTEMVIVQIGAEGLTGLGYSYGDPAMYGIIKEKFAPLVKDANLFEHSTIHQNLVHKVRNDGLPGIDAHALSAVDMALWDLKAKVLKVPLCHLWGMAQRKVKVYGSGGFTSYSDKQLAQQFRGWQKKGITQFKMKVGREDVGERVRQARKVIGVEAELFVDANGAYDRKDAVQRAKAFKEYGVSWFEEPVSSEDVEGLKLVRDQIEMHVAAGEYCYSPSDFRALLPSVDVLQADATRCLGYSGFFQAAALSRAFHLPFSSHTAPAAHLHACLALPDFYTMEYFHDHVRIEEELFEGFPKLEQGYLLPHLERWGHGLAIKSRNYLVKEEQV